LRQIRLVSPDRFADDMECRVALLTQPQKQLTNRI